MTQGPVSSSEVKVSRTARQIAYDAYAANIDIFLSATANKTLLNTTAKNGRIPEDHTPAFPLALPSIVFRFEPALKGEKLVAFLAAFEKYQIQEQLMGKNTVFTLVSPPYAVVKKYILPSAIKDLQPFGKYITVESYLAVYKLYQIADLFCATNTYPFCSSDDSGSDVGLENPVQFTGESKRGILDELLGHTKKQQKMEVVPGTSEEKPMTDDEDEEDEDEEMVIEFTANTECMRAKPSSLPSNTSFGAPKDVPYLPGAYFTYFHGMNSPDKSSLLDVTLELFFRNFASQSQTAQEGWKSFRRELGTFGNTAEGLAMTHIFQGFSFAIKSQTQAYVIFNRGEYCGFCLLGGLWRYWTRGSWSRPQSANDLQDTLKVLRTHEDVMDLLKEQLRVCSVRRGISSIDEGQMKSAIGVARALGAVDWGKVEADDTTAIERTVAELHFPTNFKGIGAESLVWAVEQMTSKLREDLPDHVSIYFPTKDFGLFARKEFQVFCCFGSRAPKFWSASGSIYTIPPLGAEDPWSRMEDDGKKKRMDTILISTAPPSQCLGGWDTVIDRQALKFDIKVRAASSKNFPIPGEKRDLLWQCLREHLIPFSVAKGRSVAHIADKPSGAASGEKIATKVDAGDIDWSSIEL